MIVIICVRTRYSHKVALLSCKLHWCHSFVYPSFVFIFMNAEKNGRSLLVQTYSWFMTFDFFFFYNLYERFCCRCICIGGNNITIAITNLLFNAVDKRCQSFVFIQYRTWLNYETWDINKFFYLMKPDDHNKFIQPNKPMTS